MAKFCTTIEQSKKLIELGLSRETSDMFYWCGTDLRIGGYKAQDKDYDIPCWSLAALLDILHDYTLQTNSDGSVFVVCDSYKPMISDSYRNPVDACVDMILLLKERSLI